MNTNVAHTSAAQADPRHRILTAALGVTGFALLTAVGAQVVIPLPHTPVPITLQTLVVLLAGMTLGPRLGLASMALYLLLGVAGNHVFAQGCWGLRTVFGATGGYLLGFMLAQPAIGVLARRAGGRWRDLLWGTLAGHAIIFACGVPWLAAWLGCGFADALALGLVPFLPGCLLKTAVAVTGGRIAVPLGRRTFGM